MWICSSCGVENETGAVCAACGARRPGARAEGRTVRLCPFCDAEIPDAAAVCPSCGAALVPLSGAEAEPSARAARRIRRVEPVSAAPSAGPVPDGGPNAEAPDPDDDWGDSPAPVRRARRSPGRAAQAPHASKSAVDWDGDEPMDGSDEPDAFDDDDWSDGDDADGGGEPADLSRRVLPIVLVFAACMVGVMLLVFALRWDPTAGRPGGQTAENATPVAEQTPETDPTAAPTEAPTPTLAPTFTPGPSPTPTSKPTPTAKPSPTPTPRATPTPTRMPAGTLEALVLEGDDRAYTESELDVLSEYELMILRNGMFALSGKIFARNQEVIDFFTACDWYTPLYESDTEVKEHMNDTQKRNVERIIAVEKEKGYR